jgi:histidyl-tRNA synthetase
VGPESAEADAEVLVLMAAAYEALEVGPVTLRVNDRRVLAGLVAHLGVPAAAGPVLRALDKREKQGDEVVRKELGAAGLSTSSIDEILRLAEPQGDDERTLAALEGTAGANAEGARGVENLRRVRSLFLASGADPRAFRVDPSIARGLDYYTGIVLEARLEALPDIGSVGSGGRYDDLAGLYTKARLPGVGCSLGISRLMDALEALGRSASARPCPSVALVTHAGEDRMEAAFALAGALRRAGVPAEVFPEPKKHAQQMRYADRQGIAFVFTPEEEGGFHGKRMRDGETRNLPDAAAAAAWVQADTATAGPDRSVS